MAQRKYVKEAPDHKEYLREYRVYNSMKARCLTPSNRQYKNYGARGITICEEWLGPNGFKNFYADMGKRPYEKNGRPYQLDRIDNNKGYSPENCRWTTVKKNQQNRRNNLNTFIFGEESCLSEICRSLGLKRTTVNESIRLRKMSIEDAVVHSLKLVYGERIHVN